MTSILTNSAALSALDTLRSIDRDLGKTQDRISSGLRIGEASDNAAYWSIAATMKSDKEALTTVNDALGLGAAKVDAAYSGLDSVRDLLSQIKARLVAAQESGADKIKINAEISQLKSQIQTVALSSSFSGENWLYSGGNGQTSKQMVGSFTRDSGGAVSLQTITFDAAKSCLICYNKPENGLLSKATLVGTNNYHLTQVTGGTTTGTEIAITSTTANTVLTEMTTAVDSMLKDVIEQASTLGAIKTRIGSQTEFVKSLVAIIENGISKLVDADMNEESTRLKALQTQQQLGIQALSIANNASQAIMQLFRG